MDELTPKEKEMLENAEKLEKHFEDNKRGRGRPKGSKNKNHVSKDARRREKKAREKLWAQTKLDWILFEHQKHIYRDFHDPNMSNHVWVMNRQSGKSFGIGGILNEFCMNTPHMRVAYITPKKNMATSIVYENFMELYRKYDCPERLQPDYKKAETKWVFKNGSSITCYGTDNNNADNMRGQTFDVVIVDEAAFIDADEYDYILKSVIFPTLTNSHIGKFIQISTPPKTLEHEFNKSVERAEELGTLVEYNIDTIDRKWMTPKKYQKILSNYGTRKNINFRREYLCERIPDPDQLVFPELALIEGLSDDIVQDVTMPEHINPVVACDWGYNDANGVLFTYWDPYKKAIVVWDELLLDATTHTLKQISEAIKLKEKKIWDNKYRITRWGDNAKQLLQEMNRQYDLKIKPVDKHEKQTWVDRTRNMMTNETLIIHPRCTSLIEQIKNAQWTKTTPRKFKRTKKHKHFDLVDPLIYAVRHTKESTIPVQKEQVHPDTHYIPEEEDPQEAFYAALKKQFNYKRRK